MPKNTEPVANVEVDEVEAKRQRKLAKRAAKEAVEVEQGEAPAEVDEAEAKRQRKAAKKAAKEAAAVEEEVTQEVDEAEAKRQRKAAKKMAKEVAAAEEVAEEIDEAEAKRQRKAAKKAAKEAAVKAAEVAEEVDEVPETSTTSKKEKRAEADEDVEEAPKSKKSKTEEAVVAEAEQENADEAKGKGKGKDGKGKSAHDNTNTVFVRGLPFAATEDGLKKDFAECGEIESFKLPLNEEGKPKGICFIKFKTEEAVDAALKFDNTDYGGRIINVSKAGEGGKGKDGKGKGKDSKGKDGKGAPDNTNTVFVRGLPFSATEDALKKDFAECGEIESFKLPLNEEGKPRGICFIKFKTEEAVDAALKFDSTDYGGRTINVAKAGEGGKGKGKDGKGKDSGKGKDGKGKGKKGKGKASSEAKAKNSGAMVESTGEKKTFDESDDE